MLLVMLLSVNLQCDRIKSIKTSEIPAFNPMVVAFTSGLISSESNIQLRFAQDFIEQSDIIEVIINNQYCFSHG